MMQKMCKRCGHPGHNSRTCTSDTVQLRPCVTCWRRAPRPGLKTCSECAEVKAAAFKIAYEATRQERAAARAGWLEAMAQSRALLIGQRFGTMTVSEILAPSDRGKTYRAKVICDCSKHGTIALYKLGKIGCRFCQATTHGHASDGKVSSTY